MSESVRRPLLSRITILLLSGWLAGMASCGWLAPSIRPTAFYAGIAGLVAFIGLDYTARLHRRTVQQRKDRRIAERLRRRCESNRSASVVVPESSPHHAG